MWWYALVVLCVLASNAKGEGEWKLVHTAQGPVRGRQEPDGVYVFYNIPYATAPTGENKFKGPLPPPSWTEPYEATDKNVICPQEPLTMIDSYSKTMQEDCLIANIYVPDTEENNLSVLVYIHGGGFQIGYGSLQIPKHLMMSKKLIVVTFNYRLGIHGFLCLGTKDVPGNAGMKDQVAMLKWIKRNIESFGGNPYDVTITGNSAGAVAADLLILSNLANGLFNKVIIESGSNLAEFAVQSDPLQNARQFAKTLNHTNIDNVYALETFYRTASYETLTSVSFLQREDSTFVFSPCVERDTGGEVFLNDTPINILKKGEYQKVPMLYGFTNMEGLFREPVFDAWKTKMNERFSDFLPADLIFDNDAQRADVAQQVKTFYFGDKAVGDNTILAFVYYFTDVMFAFPALKSVRLNVVKGNNHIYLYEYSFTDDDTPVVPHTNIRGANHCAQSWAIFDGTKLLHPDESNITFEYRNMKKTIREMWHNFITTGKPVPDGSSLPSWPPLGNDGVFRHMSLGQKVELQDTLLSTRRNFWSNIYEKYYRQPVPPPLTASGKQFYSYVLND